MSLHVRGTVLPEGVERDVFVVDDRITFTDQSDVPSVGIELYLIPGLVDVHAHLALASPAPDSATDEEIPRASARAQLEAGVLAVREPGSPDRLSFGLGPSMTLPRTYTAGRFLAPPGGYFPGLAREVEPDELPDAAEDEARRSGDWAKVIGDFFGRDGTWVPNFPPDALAEAASRVHGAGGRIAIHATVPASIEAGIEAGFDSIEHGIQLQPEHIAPMAERGIALVPTMPIGHDVIGLLRSAGAPEAFVAGMAEAIDRQPEMVRQASEGGVMVLAGTDAGMGPHGTVWQEVVRLFEAGIGWERSLGGGSWIAREWLGLSGIEEGAPADLVGFLEDPREDPSVLARPVLIVLDGTIVRTPG
jgi:imidazolonepropionase-like amidohydrolase